MSKIQDPFVLFSKQEKVLGIKPSRLVSIGALDDRPSALENLLAKVADNDRITNILGMNVFDMEVRGVTHLGGDDIRTVLGVHGYPYVEYDDGREDTFFDSGFDRSFEIVAKGDDPITHEYVVERYALDREKFRTVEHVKSGRFVGVVNIDEIERWIGRYGDRARKALVRHGIKLEELDEHVTRLTVRKAENESFLGITMPGSYRLLDGQLYIEDSSGHEIALGPIGDVSISHGAIRFDLDCAADWGLQIPEMKVRDLGYYHKLEKGVDTRIGVIPIRDPKWRHYATMGKGLFNSLPRRAKMGLFAGLGALAATGYLVCSVLPNGEVLVSPDAGVQDSGLVVGADAGTLDGGVSLDATVVDASATAVAEGHVKDISLSGSVLLPYIPRIRDIANDFYKKNPGELARLRQSEKCKFDISTAGPIRGGGFEVNSIVPVGKIYSAFCDYLERQLRSLVTSAKGKDIRGNTAYYTEITFKGE